MMLELCTDMIVKNENLTLLKSVQLPKATLLLKMTGNTSEDQITNITSDIPNAKHYSRKSKCCIRKISGPYTTSKQIRDQ